MTYKVAVIGSGFLGSYVIKEFNLTEELAIGTQFASNKENKIIVDIRKPDSITECIRNAKPDVIINCAANVDVDFLEKNKKFAFAINAEGAKNVAMIAQRHKIKLIHISTDSVFDGKQGWYSENDTPYPCNIYAKSKLRGEEFVKEFSENYVIIRTNFYGYDKKNRFLFNWILSMLKQKEKFIGFDDVIFTPLEVSNLSKMILEISTKNYVGLIHLASDDAISKYQFALMVADIFKLKKELITKGSVDDINFVANRPKNTSLVNKKAKRLLNTPITSLFDWLNIIKDNVKI